MFAKILMCSCYVEKFYEEGHEYVKKRCHFHCKCKDDHIIYILTWEKHPYVAARIPNMESKCRWTVLDAHDFCNFCQEVRYLFNFRAFKFCLKPVPQNFQDYFVTPFQYLKRMPGCQTFFK